MEQFIRTVFDKKLIDINKKEDNKDKELINKEEKKLISKDDEKVLYLIYEVPVYRVRNKYLNYYFNDDY